jgi:hypothetical protein
MLRFEWNGLRVGDRVVAHDRGPRRNRCWWSPSRLAVVVSLNHEGAEGWEAVGMTALGDGHVAVLMKRDAGTHTSP